VFLVNDADSGSSAGRFHQIMRTEKKRKINILRKLTPVCVTATRICYTKRATLEDHLS